MKKCLLIIAALFLCGKSYSLTRAEAETEVRRLIKDTASSSSLQRYSDTVLDTFINESQRQLNIATWALENSTSITLSAGSTFYSLPSDLFNVKFIIFKDSTGRSRKLQQVSYKATLESNPDFSRITGPPFNYLLRASTYTSNSSLEVAFLPIPTTSSTGTATITYIKQTTDMTSDSDVLLDGDYTLFPYHELVCYGAVFKIKLIEGDVAGASAYSGLYQAGIQAMNSRLGEMPDYNPGLSGGGSGFTGSPSR